MHKKILSAVLALCLVGSASSAFADFFLIPLDVDANVNVAGANADDRGVALDNDNHGNVIFTDELEGRNILIQGGANTGDINDSQGRFIGWECDNVCDGGDYLPGLSSTQYYMNSGNVATQINFDGEMEDTISLSTAGNLVVHDYSITGPFID